MNYKISGKIDNIVKLIKGIRGLTGLGLKEAKSLADDLRHDNKPIELRGVKFDIESLNCIHESGVDILELGSFEEVRGKLDEAAILCIKNGKYDFASEILDLLKRV